MSKPSTVAASATPEAVLDAIMTLATNDAAGFMEAFVAEPALVDAAARVAAADAIWLESALGALRRSGVSVRLQQRFKSLIRRQVNERTAAERQASIRSFRVVGHDEAIPTVRAALGDDAPVHDEAIVPAGYQLSHNGILAITARRDGAAQTTICARPIVISGVLSDEASRVERLQLAWWDRGHWRHVTMGRDEAMNRNELVKHARAGLPVHSGNANAVVRYLAEFEAVNAEVLRRCVVSSHLGWQGTNDNPSFLCGRQLLRAGMTETVEFDANGLPPADWREDWVGFYGASVGERQVAEGFAPSGTFEAWREAIAPAGAFPQVAFAVYASLAAPLLEILGAPPFIVDWCGQTSRGKTTTLMVAASVWGNPDPMAPQSVMGTWNATKVYAERNAALLHGLPVILDDTKQAKPADVASVLYLFAGGQGRGRGARDGGTRETGCWKTILLSSGEMPAVAYSQDAGTRARTLTIWGDPFGGPDAQTGIVVATLRAALKAAYGHAGPRFVRHLLDHQAQWPAWRAAYQAAIRDFIERCGGDPVGSRIAEYAAAIKLTADLAHEIDLLPWPKRDPVAPLWDALCREAGEADRPAEALRMVHSWAVSKQEHFEGQFRTNADRQPIVPTSGVLGRWRDGDDYLGFLPSSLEDFLKSKGFDVEGCIRTWKDRGWLRHDRSHATKPFRLMGKLARGYVIPHEVFAMVANLSAEDDSFTT